MPAFPYILLHLLTFPYISLSTSLRCLTICHIFLHSPQFSVKHHGVVPAAMYVSALGWVGAAEHAAVDACTPATLGIEVIHPPPPPPPSPCSEPKSALGAGRCYVLRACLSTPALSMMPEMRSSRSMKSSSRGLQTLLLTAALHWRHRGIGS